jgi:hypothetical protein
MNVLEGYPEPVLAEVDTAGPAECYRWHLEAAELALDGIPENVAVGFPAPVLQRAPGDR